MLTLDIPGHGTSIIRHLVLDFNGTIAGDGQLLDGIAPRLRELAPLLKIHVLTADTHGSAAAAVHGLPCHLAIIAPLDQCAAKLHYIDALGCADCVAMGNGFNDQLMLQHAAVGIAVIGGEGAASAAITSADVVVNSCVDGLDLLLKPLRLGATLRR